MTLELIGGVAVRLERIVSCIQLSAETLDARVFEQSPLNEQNICIYVLPICPVLTNDSMRYRNRLNYLKFLIENHSDKFIEVPLLKFSNSA